MIITIYTVHIYSYNSIKVGHLRSIIEAWCNFKDIIFLPQLYLNDKVVLRPVGIAYVAYLCEEKGWLYGCKHCIHCTFVAANHTNRRTFFA